MTTAATAATDLASTEFPERLRLIVAADCVGTRPRGPDGKRLVSALLVWSAIASLAWVVHDTHVGAWGWALMLGALLALGAWGDRRAARRRGWVSAMVRARQIVEETRQRWEAPIGASSNATSVEPAPSATPLECAHCGHRFQRTSSDAAISA